jgi:hypothetical protein
MPEQQPDQPGRQDEPGRKPRGMTFRSWVDQQISEAAERGAFENLAGAGKPLPDRGPDADQAWLMDWLRREGVNTEELLPTPLRLRKESSRLAEKVHQLRTEGEVRAAVAELNERIMSWRRLPVGGPPIFVAQVAEEAMLGRWRDAHQEPLPAPEPAAGPASRDQRRRPRWRRRRR